MITDAAVITDYRFRTVMYARYCGLRNWKDIVRIKMGKSINRVQVT
jgi:hypothetical protein